ncbi:hypothetical protein VTJ04DRAFT_7720 [Mycothermus thermophilus]|uniref:uncharacterized protein n=1 Tax=Humicola insolens TaxID=85995 RepID=UPI0037433DED
MDLICFRRWLFRSSTKISKESVLGFWLVFISYVLGLPTYLQNGICVMLLWLSGGFGGCGCLREGRVGVEGEEMVRRSERIRVVCLAAFRYSRHT